MHLSFYPIADSYLLVAGAAIVLLALLALGPARSKTTPRRRLALAALRLAIIALVLLAMLRPTLVYTETKKQAATLVVLADQTRSMTVPDALGGKSRYQVLQKALADAQPALARLTQEFELKAYTFDAEAHAARVSGGTIALPEKPAGQQTAIGAVLDDVLRFEAGKRLLGVVLLSDGAQRSFAPRDALPQTAAARLKQLGYPLFTVPLGKSRGLGQARDVAVGDLLANEEVYVKNEWEVTGQIRVDGYQNRKIPVRLLFETTPGKLEAVDETTVEAASDGQILPVHLKYIPKVPGEHKAVLEAVPQPGELVTTNNQVSTFVNVLKGGLKVLYLEGDVRVEQKFIRRALEASREINVDYLGIDARKPQTRPADLRERFQPGRYDVFILGDLDSQAFQRPELEQLAQTVNQGAGLIMLGGFHSFGPGGYFDTPLANVLPVVMDRLERQNFNDALRESLHISTPLRMEPTPMGRQQFIMQLAGSPAESARIWDELPPLDGFNKFAGLAPAAVTLAEANHYPLLVAHNYGAGRVLAFAGDSTWHWWMHGFEAAHRRFWRQIVLWLARKDQAQEGAVWLKLEDRRLAPGQRLKFFLGARSAGGDAITDFTAEAQVTLPDGTRRSIPLVRQDTMAGGSFSDTQAPGDYTLEVTAKQKDQTLGTARARFLVFAQDLELDNASADTPLMQTLAAMTGGEVLMPDELSKTIRRLTENTQHLEIRQETKKTFWDSWPFLLVFVCFLTVEWYLRKRWGLV
jgi:uncharacterized membrane protein